MNRNWAPAFAVLSLLLGLGLGEVSARADGEWLRLLETPVARYLFLETGEGSDLFSRLAGTGALTGPDTYARDLAIFRDRLARPEMAGFRTDLEARLTRIHDAFETSGDPATARELSPEDRLFLDGMAARELRLAPGWQPPEALRPGQVDFFPAESGPAAYESNRTAFLESAPQDPAYAPESPETARTPEERLSTTKRISKLMKDMRTCVANLPPAQAHAMGMRYTLSQLAIDESMTLTGDILSAGIKKMDWKNLPADMLFEAMSSTVGSRIMTRPGPVLVRWFRMGGFGLGQAGADAVLYYVSPFKDTHGADIDQATAQRMEYNVGWNMAYSPIQVGLYELVTGLECLYPGAKMAAVSTGIRIAAGLGSNFAYFRIRRHFTPHEE